MARDQGSGNPVPSLAPHSGETVLFSAVSASRSGLFTFTGEEVKCSKGSQQGCQGG